MNLQPMDNSRFAVYFTCCQCGKRKVWSRAEPTRYADLDREPLKAYYFADCARQAANDGTR